MISTETNQSLEIMIVALCPMISIYPYPYFERTTVVLRFDSSLGDDCDRLKCEWLSKDILFELEGRVNFGVDRKDTSEALGKLMLLIFPMFVLIVPVLVVVGGEVVIVVEVLPPVVKFIKLAADCLLLFHPDQLCLLQSSAVLEGALKDCQKMTEDYCSRTAPVPSSYCLISLLLALGRVEHEAHLPSEEKVEAVWECLVFFDEDEVGGSDECVETVEIEGKGGGL
jgi:hypothetical protein